MKPIKITSEKMYEHYVYKVIHSKFGAYKDFGSLENFINTTIPDNGNGLKLTIEELE